MPTSQNEQSAAAEQPGSFLASNLKRLMRHHQISQLALARETGLKQPTIHRILSGNFPSPRQKTVTAIAEFFNVRADDLRFTDLYDQSLLPVDLRGYRIPLMSARNAGLAAKKPSVRHDGDSIVVYHRVSESAFAFPVADRAMEPRFSPTDIVVVDPEMQAGPGKFVAARVDGLEEAVVRQVAELLPGDMVRLAPLNRQYPETIGRMIGLVVLRIEKVS